MTRMAMGLTGLVPSSVSHRRMVLSLVFRMIDNCRAERPSESRASLNLSGVMCISLTCLEPRKVFLVMAQQRLGDHLYQPSK